MGSPKLSSPTSQSNRIKMKTAAILLATTVGLSLAAPQNAPVWTEITGAYKSEPLKVVRPTTEAALAYMKEFLGRTCVRLPPRLTWKVFCQGRVERRQTRQQRLPTKRPGGLEPGLNLAAHAHLQRLPSGATMILVKTQSQMPLLLLPSPGLDLKRETPALCLPRPTWSQSSEESQLTMPVSALPRPSLELLLILPSPATLLSTLPAPRQPRSSSGTPTVLIPPPPMLPKPSLTPP